jgi:hypothetical protein
MVRNSRSAFMPKVEFARRSYLLHRQFGLSRRYGPAAGHCGRNLKRVESAFDPKQYVSLAVGIVRTNGRTCIEFGSINSAALKRRVEEACVLTFAVKKSSELLGVARQGPGHMSSRRGGEDPGAPAAARRKWTRTRILSTPCTRRRVRPGPQ